MLVTQPYARRERAVRLIRASRSKHKIDNAMWSASSSSVLHANHTHAIQINKACAHVQEHTIYVNLHDVCAQLSMHSLSTSRSKHKIDNAMSTASFKSLSYVYYATPLTSTTFVQRLSTVTSACPERGSDAGLHGKTIATNSDREYNRSEVGITWHERFKSVSYTRLTRASSE